jgi:hypothetical protein
VLRLIEDLIKREEVKNIMTNTTKRFTTAIATGAVLLNALAPVALASDLNVVGNGVNSTNDINVTKTSATVVNQTNNANITNNVSSKASTGGNDASYNTGGDVKVKTGDAITNTEIKNAVNLNKASVQTCGSCDGGSFDVKIKGNGVGSDNDVDLNKSNEVFLGQNNDANVSNNVDSKAKTGGNDAGFNTGGDVKIKTGDAITNTGITTIANANWAKIGGGHSANDGASVKIVGNGAYSDSDVDLDDDSAIVLEQYNDANISNDVDADANTGKNDASFNTGGEVGISTGDAWTNAEIDNLVNFNAASVDCDCVLGDLDVNVEGNGVGSDNDVDADATNELFNSQDNYAGLWNDVDGDSNTGYNDAEFSTGSVDSDPSVKTGNAKSFTEVSNGGNANFFHNGSSVHLPGDWELGVSFDLDDLMDLLHGWNV